MSRDLVQWCYSLTTVRYASEVDVDFVRRSIKAIGQTAIKIDAAAERCVNVLMELIGTRVSYVVQEAVVVMKAGRAMSYGHYGAHYLATGYFPEVPVYVRRCHPHSMRQLG